MTWATFDVWGDDEANGPEQVHVIPTYEEHDVSGDCWCRPREDDGVFVHRDKLDRDPPAPPVSDERLREAPGPAGSSSVARIFVLFGKEATMSAHEHVWRPTGYGGGSACSGKPATTFHHERCEKCGASRRVDHPSRAVRDHQEER